MSSEKIKKIKVGMVIYEQFATLDYAGPVQAFGSNYVQVDGKPDYTQPYFKIYTIADSKETPINSCEGIAVKVDLTFEEANLKKFDILLVVGGLGCRSLIQDDQWCGKLFKLYSSGDEKQILSSVCTGAVFLTKLGILDHRKATSNKLAFDWVKSFDEHKAVDWQENARFVISPPLKCGQVDHQQHHHGIHQHQQDQSSKYPVSSTNIPYKLVVTSSGVSAGTDMALRLVQIKIGCHLAKIAMRFMEYVWDNNPDDDPFSPTSWPHSKLHHVCTCDENNNNNQ